MVPLCGDNVHIPLEAQGVQGSRVLLWKAASSASTSHGVHPVAKTSVVMYLSMHNCFMQGANPRWKRRRTSMRPAHSVFSESARSCHLTRDYAVEEPLLPRSKNCYHDVKLFGTRHGQPNDVQDWRGHLRGAGTLEWRAIPQVLLFVLVRLRLCMQMYTTS